MSSGGPGDDKRLYNATEPEAQISCLTPRFGPGPFSRRRVAPRGAILWSAAATASGGARPAPQAPPARRPQPRAVPRRRDVPSPFRLFCAHTSPCTRSVLAPGAFRAAAVRGEPEQPSCCKLPFLGWEQVSSSEALSCSVALSRPAQRRGRAELWRVPSLLHGLLCPHRATRVGSEGTARSWGLRKQGESSPVPFCHRWGRRAGLASAWERPFGGKESMFVQ